jgi:uncharacterized membrane protein
MSAGSLASNLRSCVLAAVALLVVAVWWRVLSGGLTLGACAWALICTAPLWACAPGLQQRDRRTYAIFTLCAIPYLITGVTEAVASPAWRLWATSVLCIAFLSFVGAIAYLRVTRPAAAATAPRERTAP